MPAEAGWDDGSQGYGRQGAYRPADQYDGYQQDGSHAGYDDYGHDGFDQGGYGSGGYGGAPVQGGYGGSGGYPVQGGYGGSGGYGGAPVQGGYNGSGGYPAQGNGADPRDVPGRYAGNDWYGRPSGASGSGFADTGTQNLDARDIDSYGTGPRQAVEPPELVHTGQPERYDDQYSQDEYGYGQGGYGQDYEPDDPYQDGYADDGIAPPPAGKAAKTKKTKAAKTKTGAKRRKRPLLLATLTVLVVAVIAGAGYVFVLKPKSSPSSATGPLPSPGSSAAADAACQKQLGQYCHIGLRANDPTPLTLTELFPPAFTNEADHLSFTRVGTKLDKTCSKAVIGQDLIGALQDGKCTQLLRASYVSGDNQIMGTIGVANLATTNQAHKAGRLGGTNDFVEPLSTAKGVASKLGKGTGIVESEFKGHYLILIWAEFTSTNAPKTNAQDQQLQQFGNDLIAGTANISLSQRMVNGGPPTAAASPS